MEEKMKTQLQNEQKTLNVENEENDRGLLSQDDHYIVYSLLLLTLFSFGSLLCFAVLCALASFATISLGKRELVALLLLCSECHVTVIVL